MNEAQRPSNQKLPFLLLRALNVYADHQKECAIVKQGSGNNCTCGYFDLVDRIGNAERAADVVAPPVASNERCKANPTSDPPQDCDAPFCGCNPAWQECIAMLIECGWGPQP